MKSLIFAAAATLVVATAAFAAPPPVPPGVVHQTSLGCLAVDATAAEFVDPAARMQVLFVAPNKVNLICKGHLMPAAILAPAEITFSQASVPGFHCLARWEETIETDGSFTLICHSKPSAPAP